MSANNPVQITAICTFLQSRGAFGALHNSESESDRLNVPSKRQDIEAEAIERKRDKPATEI